MTGKTNGDRAALERLADALIDDILRTPDVELLAAAETDNDDGDARARSAFHKAIKASGTARKRRQPRQANVRSLAPQAARRRLREIIAHDPKTANKLTQAAEDESLSDEDVYGLLEILQIGEALEQRGRRP